MRMVGIRKTCSVCRAFMTAAGRRQAGAAEPPCRRCHAIPCPCFSKSYVQSCMIETGRLQAYLLA